MIRSGNDKCKWTISQSNYTGFDAGILALNYLESDCTYLGTCIMNNRRSIDTSAGPRECGLKYKARVAKGKTRLLL